MATSASSNSQDKVNSAEEIAQQFLSTADDYFRTEIKCMLCFAFQLLIN